MKGSLVYDIVRQVAIHPRNRLRKRNIADALHLAVSSVRLEAQETTLHGLMEIIEYMSYSMLRPYGYATPWYMCERNDVYYPLHIRALDLAFCRVSSPRSSNTLSGFRV